MMKKMKKMMKMMQRKLKMMNRNLEQEEVKKMMSWVMKMKMNTKKIWWLKEQAQNLKMTMMMMKKKKKMMMMKGSTMHAG